MAKHRTTEVRDAGSRRTAREAEAALGKVLRRFELILRSAGEGIFGLNCEGKIEFINPAGARMLGYEPAELMGKYLHEMIHSRHADGSPYPAEKCPNYAAFRDGEVHEVLDDGYWRKDGTFIPVEYVSTPIRDDGELSGAVVVFRDVTERRRAAQEAARLRDHFLSSISHEMKTPLSLVLGYAELLQDRYPDETLFTGMQDGARRLAALVGDIVDTAALMSNGLELFKTDVCVREVVDLALASLVEAAQAKDIRIVKDLPPDLPELEADARRVEQMIRQLLDNAIKFSPCGSTIRIEAARDQDFLRISVLDEGPGLASDALARIFDAFSQEDVGATVRKGGLGLGLTIVRLLAQLHKGRVEVESSPGHGSKFSLLLPIVRM